MESGHGSAVDFVRLTAAFGLLKCNNQAIHKDILSHSSCSLLGAINHQYGAVSFPCWSSLAGVDAHPGEVL